MVKDNASNEFNMHSSILTSLQRFFIYPAQKLHIKDNIGRGGSRTAPANTVGNRNSNHPVGWSTDGPRPCRLSSRTRQYR